MLCVCVCVRAHTGAKTKIKVSARLGSAPSLIQFVGRIHFLAIAGQRSLFPCWLSTRIHSLLLEATCIGFFLWLQSLTPSSAISQRKLLCNWIRHSWKISLCHVMQQLWERDLIVFTGSTCTQN
ncbi:hypothetical protein HJG60_010931 [Phyllostomus discolor]|uniref:Uncharacterized protein n=1 Tax=Phyllostomus discolor TaxID=89673 RepID=A0A834AEW0_9CHIR|nr:hypothetical protein HJG60_010931 [Phyllostomus discolor]